MRVAPGAGLSLQGLDPLDLALGLRDALGELVDASLEARLHVGVALGALADRAARLEYFEVGARPRRPSVCFLEQIEGRRCVNRIAIGGKQAQPAIGIDIHRRLQELCGQAAERYTTPGRRS